MAELFGREDGCSHGRGGSMHMFDLERALHGRLRDRRRQPADRGRARARARAARARDDATLCMFGDGASNQGTFGETMNLAALWKLPVVFMVTNNQFGMGTALERHSAVTGPAAQGRAASACRACAATAWTCSTRTACVGEALRARARASASRCWSRRSPTASAATRWPTRRSTARRSEVAEWRRRDPIVAFADAARARRACSTRPSVDALDADARRARRRGASRSPTPRPSPTPESLYDDVYVLGDQVRGWYSVDERSPGVTAARTSAARAAHAGRRPHERRERRRRSSAAPCGRARTATAAMTRTRGGDGRSCATARRSTRRCARRWRATSASS